MLRELTKRFCAQYGFDFDKIWGYHMDYPYNPNAAVEATEDWTADRLINELFEWSMTGEEDFWAKFFDLRQGEKIYLIYHHH